MMSNEPTFTTNPFAWPTLTSDALGTLEPDFAAIPISAVRKWSCAQAFCGGDRETVWLVCDPHKLHLFDWAIEHLPEEALKNPRLVHEEDFNTWLNTLEGAMRALTQTDDLTSDASDRGEQGLHLSMASISQTDNAVVRLVDSTLFDALQVGASDIHLESDPSGLTVKYRLDGALNQATKIDTLAMADQMISRIKVLAELDIGERRIPQDGRFKVNCLGKSIDLRVSIMPSVYGEDAVLRLLDRSTLTSQSQQLTLETLGFDKSTLTQIRRLAKAPYGMFLVTGPTGSGKTTTLYAALTESKTEEEKVITIEDPVEYKLDGVLQIPVNEKKGLTFAKGLRSILRHDPDKIMVGEIRDADTAQVAVQSALTGHLVFTSVHANNAFDVLGRFLHMGLDPYTFVSALNGVVAQRLVRMLCEHCKQPMLSDEADFDLFQSLGHEHTDLQTYPLLKPVGCSHCRGTGYKGRKAIAEVLFIDDVLRDKIANREPMQTIKAYALSKGTVPLLEKGMQLVRAGRTTLDEVSRVAFSN
ncbi:MAG: general secretion pathway protein GspE [Betaproteobacteria bacterium]|nr:MAG: general secretion pathway protein GspE [Betaproteobacteria bacterium]